MGKLNELCIKFFEDGNLKKGDFAHLMRSMDIFCQSGKKEDAFIVYYCFCEITKMFGHDYDTMGKILQLLSVYEYHSGELLSKHRDHYSHSVYVFALGLMIYANNRNYRYIFNRFYKTHSYEFFLKYWGYTALFHDIGYPFELTHQQMKSYSDELWGKNSKLSPHISYENMEGLLLVNQVPGKLNLILAKGICEKLNYDFDEVYNALSNRYSKKPDYMDHAYFSTLLLARQMIEIGEPLKGIMVDVLTAIALHNSLNKYDLDCSKPVQASMHPLAYLLMLCDELQCWDRTAFGIVSKKDPLPRDVNFEFEHNNLKIEYIFEELEMTTPNKSKVKNVNKDKIEKNLNEDIKGIIDGGICLLAICKAGKPDEKDKKLFYFKSSENLINFCEIAKAIHENYQKSYNGENFEKLSLENKLSNLGQAKSYAIKLAVIGCFYSDKELDYPVVNEFSKKEVDILARYEHARWVKEKLINGWKYGSEKDENSKKNPDIVNYESLTRKEKKKNIDTANNMISILYEQHHKIRIYKMPYGELPILNIAGFGHRTISSKQEEIKKEIKAILKEYMKKYFVIVYTAYAHGADQLIAECANSLGIITKAVLPFPKEIYVTKIIEDAQLKHYYFNKTKLNNLLAQTVECKELKNKDNPYLAASKYLIKHCDKVIALWDGVETPLEDKNHNPINQGCTYHCIKLSLNKGLKENEDIHIIHCKR